ncbi:MAG: transaldolase, partial [Actinomycetota bacterium]|nr:transaldolase [Actinomycetota bacterium]
SVASFFVSRIDTEVDKRLDAIDSDEAKPLRSKAAVANARLAYQEFERVFSSERWSPLESAGAHRQRPLWASTSVKDPNLPDTMYVVELVAPETVNTMPEATIEATADHGEITGDRVTTNYDDAQQVLDRLERLGISYDDVVKVVEDEGVDKFEKSWQELIDTVRTELERARA